MGEGGWYGVCLLPGAWRRTTLTGTGFEFHLWYLRSTMDQCGDRWFPPAPALCHNAPHRNVTNSVAHPRALVGPEIGCYLTWGALPGWRSHTAQNHCFVRSFKSQAQA